MANDQEKTKEQLIVELQEARRRITELESLYTRLSRAEQDARTEEAVAILGDPSRPCPDEERPEQSPSPLRHPRRRTEEPAVTLEDRRTLQTDIENTHTHALITVSQEVLAERTVEGLLQRIVDAGRSLTGARFGVSGYGLCQGQFRVGAISRGEDASALPSGDILRLIASGVYRELIEKVISLRLTDEELRRYPACSDPCADRLPLRGLLGARLTGRDGQAHGLILVSDKKRGEFTSQDEALLVQLATLASLGLQHIEARKEVERRAEEMAAMFAAREQLLEQLETEQSKLNAIIENAPEGIIVADSSGQIVLTNPAARRLYTHPEREPTAAESDEQPQLCHPDGTAYDPHDLPLARAALDGESQADVEMVLVWPDGQRRDLLVNAAPIHDRLGRITGAMALFQDITHRKRMEEAVRRRNLNLELLNRVSQLLASILDLPELLNRLLEAMTEILDTDGSSVWLWAGDGPEELRCQAMYRYGARQPQTELRLRAGEGVAGWVAQYGESMVVPDVRQEPRFSRAIDLQIGFETRSLLAVPLRSHDRIIGVLEAVNKHGGSFDRSDALLAETLAGAAAIAIQNAQLVEALRQRTEELRARNAELNAFAHTVAHDLKQPLTVMVGFSELLYEDFGEFSEEQALQQLEAIRRLGRKMQSIIDELLFLSEVRDREVELERIEMASVVAEAQHRLAPLIAETGAEIVAPAPEEWPPVLGYAPWLEEVWVNYLSNALKYGGCPPHVELGSTAEPDGVVRFWVRDKGPGLSPEEQALLFAPFTRLQKTTPGSGLGLSIVRRIVEKMGGQVAVESEGVPGQGSLFSFTLPAANGEGRKA